MTAVDVTPTEVAPAESFRRIDHVLIVVNPASRTGSRVSSFVQEAARCSGIRFTSVETRGPRDATRIVREMVTSGPEEYDAVLTVGGDGTAMEAATALAAIPDAPPLGVIAVGTANVLARSLGIPLGSIFSLDHLCDADVVALDLGRITDGPMFAIGLGVGLDASMIMGATSRMKQRIGYAAYVLSALRAGLRLEKFTARVTVDGVVHERQTSSVLVANFGVVLADLLCFGEAISPQDGMLDVCFYSPTSLLDAMRIFVRMVFGGVAEDRCVHTIRGRSIRVETDAPRSAQADGELLGRTPIDITVEPGALRILVPRAKTRRWRLRRQGTPRLSAITPAPGNT